MIGGTGMQTKGNFVPVWTEGRVETCSELRKRPIKGEYLVELLRSERAPPTMYNENVTKRHLLVLNRDLLLVLALLFDAARPIR